MLLPEGWVKKQGSRLKTVGHRPRAHARVSPFSIWILNSESQRKRKVLRVRATRLLRWGGPMLADLGEVAHEIVMQAEQGAGLPGGVDEAVGLPSVPEWQTGCRTYRGARRLFKTRLRPASEVRIPMLSTAEELDSAAEQLESFGETPCGSGEEVAETALSPP